ncbi:hypothetical protein ACFLW6_01670 [Chloroflexota bacterium]
MIKRMISKLHEESGQALALVMVLFVFGSLAIVPLLQYTTSSLPINETDKQLTVELYAAEAGAKDAIRHLVEKTGEIPEVDADPWTYNIAPVDGKAVDVTVYREEARVFHIISGASGDDGGRTEVDTYIVSMSSLMYVFDKAIISNGDIDLGPGSDITGDVEYVDEARPTDEDRLNEQITGDIIRDEDGLDWWPTTDEIEDLTDWYRDETLSSAGVEVVPDGHIIDTSSGEEADPVSIGPLYCEGDLQIKGVGWARIDGLVFAEGSIDISPTPALTMDLLGQTLFAACWADFSEDPFEPCDDGFIKILPDTTVVGSGCIIAIGDIDYQPSYTSEEYILLWSLGCVIRVKPGSLFVGSAVAALAVDCQPNTDITYAPPPEGFIFPGYDDTGYGTGYDFAVRTWEVDAIPYTSP